MTYPPSQIAHIHPAHIDKTVSAMELGSPCQAVKPCGDASMVGPTQPISGKHGPEALALYSQVDGEDGQIPCLATSREVECLIQEGPEYPLSYLYAVKINVWDGEKSVSQSEAKFNKRAQPHICAGLSQLSCEDEACLGTHELSATAPREARCSPASSTT